MASVGHIVVGMAAARVHDTARDPAWPAMAFWSAISLLPDADVIGFGLGIRYADEWGHRGATHSLIASIGILGSISTRTLSAPCRSPRLIAKT